jgi:hypothetical protein
MLGESRKPPIWYTFIGSQYTPISRIVMQRFRMKRFFHNFLFFCTSGLSGGGELFELESKLSFMGLVT